MVAIASIVLWTALYIVAAAAGIAAIGIACVLICRFLVSCGLISGADDLDKQSADEAPAAWPPPPTTGS